MRRWRPKWDKKERLGDLPRFHIVGSFPIELRPTNIDMEDGDLWATLRKYKISP